MPDAESEAGLTAPNQTQQKEHAMPETTTPDPAYAAIESVLNAHAGTTTGPDKEHVWCRPECGWVGHDWMQHRAHVAGALATAGIAAIADAKADALREAADDLGDTMMYTFWDAVVWLSARAAAAESEAGRLPTGDSDA